MAKIDPKEPCPCESGKLFGECHGTRVVESRPTTITQRVSLRVIPEPDPQTRAVFIRSGDGTVIFQGQETQTSQDCGACGSPLIVGLRSGQVQGVVLRCNNCGAFNDTAS